MRRWLMFAFLCAACFTSSSLTMACGGYEVTSIEPMVEFSELVVSGRIVFVDDFGKNFVLQIDRYYKGSGGQYLPIVKIRPAVYYDTARDYDHGCGDLGWWGRKFQEDQYGYFALQANHDGTYNYYFESIWIPGDVDRYRNDGLAEGMVDFHIHRQSDLQVEAPLPIAEFESLLLQLSEREKPVLPATSDYPLFRFLNIITESGKRYRLNPDRSVTWLDPAKWPIAISNDGSHVMFRLERDELAFQYLDLEKKEPVRRPDCGPLGCITVDDEGALPIKGWYAQFSPDSNFVAVQDRNELLIYMFDNLTLEKFGYGRLMSMEVIASRRVRWDPFFGEEPMAWSADSTTIAYQDSRGIWHWDIFEETHPKLVLPDAGDETLLDISRSGRYLRYSHNETWSLLDIKTGEARKRAIATPDERNLILVWSRPRSYMVDGFSGKRYSYLHNAQRTCLAPLSNCPVSIESPDDPFDFFEFQPGWIGLVSRNSVQVYPWYLAMEESHLSILVNPPSPILAFDYDDLYNLPAIAYDDYMIAVGFTTDLDKGPNEEGLYSPINLSGQIDSPIVEVEWSQPVFLERR